MVTPRSFPLVFGLLVGCGGGSPPPPLVHAPGPATPPRRSPSAPRWRGVGTAPRATTAAACAACGGTWGQHGMARVDSCVCPTTDGGKRCTSPRECEAACVVADGYRELFVTCTAAGCTNFDGDPIDPPPATCAPTYGTYGCADRLAEYVDPDEPPFVAILSTCAD